MYDGSRVKIGPGTLYVAPLGTAEPTGVTGAWTGWTALGYTDTGSTFTIQPTVQPVTVEEEYWPVKNVITAYTAELSFALAEQTRQNLLVALNAGIGSSLVAGTSGTNGDGSQWAEMPDIGDEVRVMLGWDSITKGATTSADPFTRLIARQCLQTGQMQRVARKGNNKSVWACKFTLEKPASALPFRFIFEPDLAS